MKFNYYGQGAELTWYSQDIMTASVDTVYGREILCRGFITATKSLIPMAELFSYLHANHELLLAMTCQQIKDSCQESVKTQAPNIKTWINLAGQLITDNDLFEYLYTHVLCSLTAQQKQNLVLEICEDDISDEVVVARLSFLKTNGFIIAMDDFGSGHSNLLRLSHIHFDIIKLDLQLLTKVPDDLWAASFYREIVNVCSSVGSLIVAEGVETSLQSDFVRWAGVDLIQGFLYSRPKPLNQCHF